MNQKVIIFDFDGTIADTIDAIIDIYNRIAPKYRCKTIKKEDRKKFQEKKPQELLKECGVTKLKLPFLWLHLRRKLRSEIKEIEPITGTPQALKDIKAAGFRLGIVTSNSKENVEIFLEANGLQDVFDFIYPGRKIFGKDKVISHLLENHEIKKDSAVYVGDEARDIEAAKETGIPVVAVSWGFYPREILVAQNPNEVIDEPKNLLECLQKI